MRQDAFSTGRRHPKASRRSRRCTGFFRARRHQAAAVEGREASEGPPPCPSTDRAFSGAPTTREAASSASVLDRPNGRQRRFFNPPRSLSSIAQRAASPRVLRMAAVVGVPDATRTEIVKAFIVLNEGFAPGDALVREIQEHVRTRLAAHEYPREVEFLDELPMTTTGKIVRRALRERASEGASSH